MRFLINLILTAITLNSGGCGITPKSPAVHDFGISMATHSNPPVTNQDITVEAPKWLQDNRIRYRLMYSAPTQVRFYTMDRWIAPPSELLEQQLESGDKSLPFPIIIRLHDFEQQFESPKQARVIMRFSVEAFSIDHKKKIGTQEFRFDRLSNTPDAHGAVNAFSLLVRQADDKIQSWLTGLSEQ